MTGWAVGSGRVDDDGDMRAAGGEEVAACDPLGFFDGGLGAEEVVERDGLGAEGVESDDEAGGVGVVELMALALDEARAGKGEDREVCRVCGCVERGVGGGVEGAGECARVGAVDDKVRGGMLMAMARVVDPCDGHGQGWALGEEGDERGAVPFPAAGVSGLEVEKQKGGVEVRGEGVGDDERFVLFGVGAAGDDLEKDDRAVGRVGVDGD